MWFGGMMLWMVLFWVGVVVLAVWMVGSLFPRVPQGAQQSAREILQTRYARGELSREQYQEMLRELA
ncbi:MAG TPA: SHOCT domain-containing protein [bacterium]|nr:SHOCT domain-containing protein [bacterium]